MFNENDRCPKHHVGVTPFDYDDGNSISTSYQCDLCEVLKKGTASLSSVRESLHPKPVAELIDGLLANPVTKPSDIRGLVEDLNRYARYVEQATKNKIINHFTNL